MSRLLQKLVEDDPRVYRYDRYTLQAPVQKNKQLRSMLFTLTYSLDTCLLYVAAK